MIDASLILLVANGAIDDAWPCGTGSVDLAFAEGFASISRNEVLTNKKLNMQCGKIICACWARFPGEELPYGRDGDARRKF